MERSSGSTRLTRRDLTRWSLAIFAMSGFAVAQPLFDILSRHPTYLVAHGIEGVELPLLAVATILVPPLALMVPVAIAGFVSRRAAFVLCAVVAGALLACAFSPVFAKRLGAAAQNVAFAALLIGGAVLFRCSEVARRYLQWLSPAPVVFVVLFLGFGPVAAFFRAAPAAVGSGVPNDVPVVHLVLDELALGSLLKPDGSIDAARFPSFGRLAERSTWYPNATTNSNVTRHAVPAALTGVFPKVGAVLPPTASVYPNNAFTLMGTSRRLPTSETVTSLCPQALCDRTALPATAPKDIAADTALVYMHAVSPPLVKAGLPSLKEAEWGGFFVDPLTVQDRVSHLPAPLKPLGRVFLGALADYEAEPYSRELRRFESFIRSIDRPVKPTSWFHHALLPHTPWHLSDDAQPYDDQFSRGFANGGFTDRPASEEGLQRYVLQLKATDRLLGDLMERLRTTEVWDDALVIVHADHGLTFSLGGPYRSIARAPKDTMPIPLFVKFPGQRRGKVDLRNAELVDVLPTIADVLDVRVGWRVDGSSLGGPDPERAHKRAWQWTDPAQALPVYGPRIDPTPLSRTIRRLFGPMSGRHDVYAWGKHRSLLGRRVAEMAGSERVGLEVDQPERFDDVEIGGPYLPTRVSASLDASGYEWIAVTLNGRVAGLGRPYAYRGSHRVSVVLSPRLMRRGTNEIGFVGITPTDDMFVLMS